MLRWQAAATLVAVVLATACWTHPALATQVREESASPLGAAAGLTLREAREHSRELVRAERFVEAIPYQRRMLQIARRKDGAVGERVGSISMELARSYFRTRRYGESETLAREAVGILEAALGPDDPKVAKSLVILGNALGAQVRREEALEHYLRALRIHERVSGPESGQVVSVLLRLATLYRQVGRHLDSEAAAVRMLAIAENAFGPDDERTADALTALARVLQADARYAEAEPAYKRALVIREATLGYDHPKVSGVLAALARIYEIQRRTDSTRQLLGRALTIREAHFGVDHPAVAKILVRLADLHLATPEVALALAEAERALAITEHNLGPDHPRNVAALKVLANAHRLAGRFADARPLLARALAIHEQAFGAGHAGTAKLLMQFALLARDEGRLDEAETFARRAVAAATGGQANAPLQVSMLEKLAGIYRLEKRWPEALDASRRATALLRARFEDPAVTDGEPDLAGGLESEQDFRRSVFIGHVVAAEHLARDAPALAAEAFEVAQLAQATGTARALSSMAARFATGSTALAQLVREHQDAVERWRSADAELTEASARDTGEREPQVEAALRRLLAELETRIAGLDGRLREEFPEYAGLARPGPLPFAPVQALLAPDEALVSFLFGRNNGYAWVVRAHDLRLYRLHNVSAEALSSSVMRLRESLDPVGASDLADLPPFDTRLAFDTYRQLLGPLADALDGVDNLLVVADGALQSLPLGVLVMSPPPEGSDADYRGIDWLARRYAVSVLPSVESLGALRRLAPPRSAREPFAGFGDPSLGSAPGATRGVKLAHRGAGGMLTDLEALRRLPALPETAEELRSIARSLRADERSVHLGASATETLVKSLPLSTVRVIAFATHGLIAGDLDGLDEPSLVLTPPARATRVDDGLLTMSEVATLELDADWVILSACNTASADGTPGAQGLSGLARAFFYAGTRALLVSHWPVASDAAVQLTTGTLAAAVARPGIGRAGALRAAMSAVIDDAAHPHFAHPLFWAPFSLVGESGRGSVSKP